MTSNDTWRLCHPVNINVYRNGVEGEAPTLVHIPAEKKRNMETVLEAIQERVKMPAGYPKALYEIDGSIICQTHQLEMYGSYVVLSSMERRFKCVDYGRPRSPLVVVGRESKNVRNIRLQNKNFNRLYGRRKELDKQQKYGFASNFISDGFGPTDLPYINNSSKQCGVLCQRAGPRVSPAFVQPLNTQISCEDECDDAALYSRYLEESQMVNFPPKKSFKEEIPPPPPPPRLPPYIPEPPQPKPQMVDESIETEEIPVPVKEPSPVDSEHLIEFINRYRDIGGDIYHLFNERLVQDDNGVITTKSTKRTSILRGDSRLGDDLYRYFANRIIHDENESLADIKSVTYESETRSMAPFFMSSRDIQSNLASLTDLKNMDDLGTGNWTAPEGGTTDDEDFSLAQVGGDTINLTSLPESVDNVTGTTVPYTSSNISNSTNIFRMEVEEQKFPFVLRDGKLLVEEKTEYDDSSSYGGKSKMDKKRSPTVFDHNVPCGDSIQYNDWAYESESEFKMELENLEKRIRDSIDQSCQTKFKTRNVCAQIGPSLTEDIIDASPMNPGVNSQMHEETYVYDNNVSGDLNKVSRFGRKDKETNFVCQAQSSMVPVSDSSGNIMYYILSYNDTK